MDHQADEDSSDSRTIIMHPLYLPKQPPWFDLRVFYIRVSNSEVDESIPQKLKVSHIPLSPETILEVNGRRSSIHSDSVTSVLRRDRVDKNSEEATFVSTDSIRMTGSVRFEVFFRDEMLLMGVFELSNCNGFHGESKNNSKKWDMKCQDVMTAKSFLKGKQHTGLPTIEVYVAGSFSGTPIILSKTLQLSFWKKTQKKLALDSIPEDDSPELRKVSSKDSLQVSEYRRENDVDVDYNSVYSRAEYVEGEDGELSWFNAGVRVGVGIGLGICLGIGIGVGVLVRSYQSTTRNFKRRII